MKVAFLVLVGLAVSYAVPVFRVCENQKTDKGKIILKEHAAGDMVRLECPTSNCNWYHEDNQVPPIYGDWMTTIEGHFEVDQVKVEHSGTYYTKIGNMKHIYQLTVIPATMTKGTDDLFEVLKQTEQTTVGETYMNKYLYNTNVNGKKFINVNFNDVHFHRAEFEYTTFINVKFTWTSMLPSKLQFYRCTFVNVTWENAMIVDSQFRNCKWSEHADTDRAVFKTSTVRNTIFCDNMWTNTKWEDMMVYNTTFVKNWFTAHKWESTRFFTYYVAKVDCKAIRADWMVVGWKMTNDKCEAYAHMPGAQMMSQCNYMDENERKMCHFYPSVRFLNCDIVRSVFEECTFSGMEWHRTKFDRNILSKVTIDENYFMYCTWICNTWSDISSFSFVKFMANDFRGDRMKFSVTTSMWLHSSKLFDVDMRWSQRSIDVHFEFCIGEKIMWWGRHTVFKLVHSTWNNVKFQRVTMKTLEYCNSYLVEWSVSGTKISNVKEICDGEYYRQICGNTWSKGRVALKGDVCDYKNFFEWCKKEHNLHHPACIPFIRSSDPSCCTTKGSENCGLQPTTWQWWKSMDLKCKDKLMSRMGDDGDLAPSTPSRWRPLNKVPYCIQKYTEMVTKKIAKSFWVRDLIMDEKSSLPKKFLMDISPPRSQEKIEEHRMQCDRMEAGTVRDECEKEVYTKGQNYMRIDMERENQKGLINPFVDALDRHIMCSK